MAWLPARLSVPAPLPLRLGRPGGRLALCLRRGHSAMLVAEVDDAETVAVRICQHDEVRVVRIAVPVDPFGSTG
jgi:hypothetical protein